MAYFTTSWEGKAGGFLIERGRRGGRVLQNLIFKRGLKRDKNRDLLKRVFTVD